jgi:hypothetical protein
MSKFFQYTDMATLLKLNLGAMVVIAFCEVFVVFMFVQKGMAPEVVAWKYWAYLFGLVLISILFVGSIISMVIFMRMKRSKRR